VPGDALEDAELRREATDWELLVFELEARAAWLLELAAVAWRAFQVASLARRLLAQASPR